MPADELTQAHYLAMKDVLAVAEPSTNDKDADYIWAKAKEGLNIIAQHHPEFENHLEYKGIRGVFTAGYDDDFVFFKGAVNHFDNINEMAVPRAFIFAIVDKMTKDN